MTLLHWLSHVQKKSAAHVVHVVMAAQATVLRVTAVVVHAVPLAPTPPLPMAVTSLLVQVAMPNPPLSAFAQSPRQLQQLTVNKE